MFGEFEIENKMLVRDAAKYAAHTARRSGREGSRRHIINFLKGHPNPKHLPHEYLNKAFEILASKCKQKKVELNYTKNQGLPNFLQSLAQFIQNQCKHDIGGDSTCRSDLLFATGGVSHSIDLACAVFGGAGKVCLAESPSYFLAFEIFKAHGMDVVGLPTDENGIIPELVEEMILKLGAENINLLYLVPTHSNPSGTTLPLDRREALVKLSIKYKFKIIADEVYHLLDWSEDVKSGGRPSRMAVLDPNYASGEEIGETEEYEVPAQTTQNQQDSDLCGGVISVSAFTKICCPGLRLGWIESSPSVIEKLKQHAYIQSGGGLVPIQAQVATELLEGGHQASHLSSLKLEYSRRSRVLCSEIEKYPHLLQLAGGAKEHNAVAGGYFVWVTLVPSGIGSAELQELAKDRFQVDFLPGSRCHPNGIEDPSMDNKVRLCFAYLESDEELREGVKRLAEAVAAASGLPVVLSKL